MTTGGQRNLRFSVEEAVWLGKGQEIEEMLSLALEPEVSIEENKHYISVRGSLRLTGEYVPGAEVDEEDEEERVFSDQNRRLIDEAHVNDEGVGEMTHRFPLDITIPYSRVGSLDDLYVTVESFDYQLSDKRCVEIVADVAISGMVDESQSLETKKQEEEHSEKSSGQQQPNLIENDYSENEKTEEEELLLARGETEQEREFSQPFHFEAELSAEEEENEASSTEDIERPVSPVVEMKSRAEAESPPKQLQTPKEYERLAEETAEEAKRTEEDESANHQSENEKGTAEKREENALYLTKMMTKEEEQFSRLKMCIIQRGESLSTIAKRYDLSPSQLVRVNGLSSEDVEEGQILYIPE